MSSFIQDCVDEISCAEDIDDYIDRWHEDKEDKSEIHEYLGMDIKEYNKWVRDPDVLDIIITSYKLESSDFNDS